ncbi:MAG: hypothetical protein ACLRPE_13065 [Blautia producta]
MIFVKSSIRRSTMEFTKVRVRNLPTEEEYIQKKNKEYQVLKKMSKISAISNSIVALAMFAIICIGIAKHSSFDVGAFIMVMVTGGGLMFFHCKWAFEDVQEYKERKKKYELFQIHLSSDEENETKFVHCDTEVCGKFTGLYFIRMLKENIHPHVWCELWTETAAVLWFKYKGRNFMIPLAAKEICDSSIMAEECIYEFNGKDGGIIYYTRKIEESASLKAEIIIETESNLKHLEKSNE